MTKNKSIKLSDYFEIKKPTYTYIKILPHSSIRNYNSSNIVKSIALTYKSLDKRIKRENKKLIFDTSFTISYIIDIYKDNASFYFRIPLFYKNVLLEKIKEIWTTATVSEVEGIEELKDPERYSVSYKKEDGLSISTDSRSNEPLNSLLSVMDIMKDDDRVRIYYNFDPCSQNYWKEMYNDTMNKVKKMKPLEKNKKSFEYMIKTFLGSVLFVLDSILSVIEDFTGGKKEDEKESIYTSVMSILGQQNEISKSTKQKKDATVLNTSIIVESSSQDLTRKNNNALSCCQAYRILDEDNELIYKKLSKNEKPEHSTMSTKEAANFVKIPGETLLNEYNIDCIELTESAIPEELREGTVSLGYNVFRGKKTKAYISNDKEYKKLPLAIVAPSRSGKTTFIENVANDCINAGECVVNFDFCGQCKASKHLESVINKEKVFNIDLSDISNLQGMGFNEMDYKGDNDFMKYDSAKGKTNTFLSFIDSINLNSPLEPRMRRYLKAACMLVFYRNGSFMDIFKTLEDYNFRNALMNDSVKDLEDYKNDLEEINDRDKNGELKGTKFASIQGILNRIDTIKENTYMELMCKRTCEKNINLVEEFQKNQLINIKMPENMFRTWDEKDVYTLYWLSKIWGALQQRSALYPEKELKVNLLIDEIYQVNRTQDFVKRFINQIAKKECKVIISCHSIDKIKFLKGELVSSNASFVLIQGCTKENYKELKEELEPYTLNDLLKLKEHSALNLVKYRGGYARFITELPKPVIWSKNKNKS